ncbi:MAG: hypothetical protein ROR55_21180 [Devosia sp.]
MKSGNQLNEALATKLAPDLEALGYKRVKRDPFAFIRTTTFGTRGIDFSESIWPDGVNYITNFGIHDVGIARYKYEKLTPQGQRPPNPKEGMTFISDFSYVNSNFPQIMLVTEANYGSVELAFYGIIIDHVLPILEKIDTHDDFYKVIDEYISRSPCIFSKLGDLFFIVNAMVGLKIERWPDRQEDLQKKLRWFLSDAAVAPVILRKAKASMERYGLDEQLEMFSSELASGGS